MSGIVGIYYPSGQPVALENLGAMVDSLAHRGRDGADVWHQDHVGLGHRMLWTTPESLLEKLPWCDRNTDTVITADARIDNRSELISLLGLKDQAPEKITDSSLILLAYHKWGVDCPQKLIGDFAFAIWDKCKKQLFCARDHFGVKPFYYYFSNSMFTFASEIKGVLSLPEVPRQLDEARIANYMIGDFDRLDLTSYQDIFRLPPAHHLTINRDGMNIDCYWSLDPSRQTHLESDEAYAAEFKRIFTEAVRCRLRSAFPLGSKLSGGLDSSAVASVAKNLLNEDKHELLHTFSAVFDRVIECDESAYIDAVLEKGGFQPHYMLGDSRTPLTDLEEIFWHQDEAFFAPGFAAMSWGLSKLARDHKVRVLLDGHDGDSTVSHGFGYLHDLASESRWLALYIEIKGVARIYNESVWRGFWNYFYAYAVRKIITRFRLNIFRKASRKFFRIFKSKKSSTDTHHSFEDDFNPDFVERNNLTEHYRQWLKFEQSSKRSSRQEHYRILTQGLHPLALEIDDKAAAASGIEIRYPFWDKRLVEFCLSLPPEQKLYQGWSRIVMRRGMQGILAPKIQWRTSKMDFTPNFKYGLLTEEKQRLEQLIFQEPEFLEGYINMEALKQKYRTGQDLHFVWRAVSFGLWLRYLDRQSSNQPVMTSEHQTMTSKIRD